MCGVCTRESRETDRARHGITLRLVDDLATPARSNKHSLLGDGGCSVSRRISLWQRESWIQVPSGPDNAMRAAIAGVQLPGRMCGVCTRESRETDRARYGITLRSWTISRPPQPKATNIRCSAMAGAPLVGASACGTESRGFKSHQPPQVSITRCVLQLQGCCNCNCRVGCVSFALESRGKQIVQDTA